MLAATIARHPARFARLAAIAPHAGEGSVREIERAMTTLGLGGIIVNSHTHGEYLDDPKFWPSWKQRLPSTRQSTSTRTSRPTT